jgi:hypothetical protein
VDVEIQGCLIDPADCDEELKAIQEEAFSWAFSVLYERCKWRAEAGGGLY